MSFTGNEDHSFPLATASEWTKNYRDESAAAAAAIATEDGAATVPPRIAHFFGKAAIQAILDQADCVGIRIYYALDEDDNKQLIIVGADEDENDLYEGLLAERSYPCPSSCSSANPLNS